MGFTTPADATLSRTFLVEGGYSLNRGEAHAGVGTREAVVGGTALDGEGVSLRLELADGGLYLLQLDVGVVVELDVGGQAPIFESVRSLDEEVESRLVGRHALDKPEREDVGGSVGDDGGEGLEFMDVDARVGSPEGTLGQVGPWDATDIAGEEAHAVLADVEVGHEPVVVSKVWGAVGCEKEGGSGVGVGEVTLQLCESLLELGEGLLEIGGSLEVGLGGDIGVITGAA